MAATPEGTRSYFLKRSPGFEPVTLGRTGFTVSPVGFGGYRIHDADAEHRAALEKALTSGCNLIDTSTNYTDGGSERLIGAVLKDLIRAGRLSRDEVVIVTKAGYIQGENLALARARASDDRPFPHVVRYSEDCWHCIAPEFLEDQITRSLDRLKTDRLDVVLLHNPEYFLKTAPDHEEYYRRIEAAMRHLETEADRGRISFYGVSSNTFPDPKDADEFTSLEAILDIADGIGPKNRFAVIQFPFNLLEPGAAVERSNTGQTVLELARDRELGTLINRPLNAFAGSRMIRLADFPKHAPANISGAWDDRLRRAFDRATGIETDLHRKAGIYDFYAWGHILAKQFGQVQGITHWRDLYTRQIIPTAEEVLSRLERSPDQSGYAAGYRSALEELFSELRAYYESVAAERSEAISEALDRAAPELQTSSSLSRKAIRIYRSVPGVSSVLVGMRRKEYVSDALALEPPIPAESAMRALEAAVRFGDPDAGQGPY